MKPKYNRRRRVSTLDAIRLHAEANKSDPFAAKRMAMTLARDGYKEIEAVATESKRILDARDSAIKRAYADWVKSEQRVAMQNKLFFAALDKVDAKFATMQVAA